jgi:hypothetical protein
MMFTLNQKGKIVQLVQGASRNTTSIHDDKIDHSVAKKNKSQKKIGGSVCLAGDMTKEGFGSAVGVEKQRDGWTPAGGGREEEGKKRKGEMESRTKMRAEIIRLGTSLDRYCVVSACGLINGHI